MFSVYIEPDYKFLQKAVDSYYVALYNPTFGFIRCFKSRFNTKMFYVHSLICVETIK
jgi:hypothetical protein